MPAAEGSICGYDMVRKYLIDVIYISGGTSGSYEESELKWEIKCIASLFKLN